jgi:cytidylate kinase
MKLKGSHTIQEIIDHQLLKWQAEREERRKEQFINVITISRETGSAGREIAKQVAQDLGYDFFSHEIIQKVAESAHIRDSIVESLDEKGRSVIAEMLLSLVEKQYLWPYEFLEHLTKVIGTIARHGRAVLLGRGSQFVLPPDEALRVRIIAPLEKRVMNLAHELGIAWDEAERRIVRDDAERKAFARKYFHANLEDPCHYDLIINSWYVGIEGSVEAIKTALKIKKIPTPPWKKIPEVD